MNGSQLKAVERYIKQVRHKLTYLEKLTPNAVDRILADTYKSFVQELVTKNAEKGFAPENPHDYLDWRMGR